MKKNNWFIHFHLLGLFPQMFSQYLWESILGRAYQEGLFWYTVWNLADFSVRPTRRVDDRPFGGWSGTILSPEPIKKAIDHIEKEIGTTTRKVVFTPRGRPLNQNCIESQAHIESIEHVLLLCGRYEGIDERILEYYQFEQYCLGPFILTGWELPALVYMDATIRLIPGVIDIQSLQEESFSNGYIDRIEGPQYTRPRDFQWMIVPEALVSWNHKIIEQWKQQHYKHSPYSNLLSQQ
jgi:tRNA (guanine37-N1)-methyltransferase